MTGGAQRVVLTLSNFWLAENRVIIAVLNETEYLFNINPQIGIIFRKYIPIGIPKLKGVINLISSIRFLRKVYQTNNPDIVISFLDTTNITAIIANIGIGKRLIISERLNPLYSEIEFFWKFLRKKVYKYADSIVLQTTDIQDVLKSMGVKLPKSVQVIPNPVKKTIHNSIPKRKQILAVGRLHRQKGFDLLLKAYSLANINWMLFICGDGPEKDTLHMITKELNLEKKVSFLGDVKDVEGYYAVSEIFVLSSRYEGMPNALLEAMSYSCACISFDCPSGPRDIIVNNENGVIIEAENVNQLAKSIKTLTEEDELRHKLSTNAARVNKDFAIEKIVDMWERLILEVVAYE